MSKRSDIAAPYFLPHALRKTIHESAGHRFLSSGRIASRFLRQSTPKYVYGEVSARRNAIILGNSQ
jgi:hypothetical protein